MHVPQVYVALLLSSILILFVARAAYGGGGYVCTSPRHLRETRCVLCVKRKRNLTFLALIFDLNSQPQPTQALETFVRDRADLVRFCADEFRRRQCVLGAKFDATGEKLERMGVATHANRLGEVCLACLWSLALLSPPMIDLGRCVVLVYGHSLCCRYPCMAAYVHVAVKHAPWCTLLTANHPHQCSD
jgi:hypothetical protein